jgi:hypothetical protein
LISKDVIIEKKIKLFKYCCFVFIAYYMFFLYGLVSWQSADPGIETYAVYWGGGGGVETGRADSGQQTGDNGDRWESRQQTFRVADRKEIQSKKRL